MRIVRILAGYLALMVMAAWAHGPAESGWVPLFNGQDLSGWRAHGAEKWVVENGEILGESTVGKYGYLTT
jgi:hypothetical protein